MERRAKTDVRAGRRMLLLGTLVAFLGYAYGSTEAPTRVAFVSRIDAVYFTRLGNAPDADIVRLIDGARRSVRIAAFALTHDGVIDALMRARGRGLDVRVVTDVRQTNGAAQRAQIERLARAGIPIKWNDHRGVMHLKLLIVDREIAGLGSYNFTRAASERNDEVWVVTRESAVVRELADAYDAVWNDRNRYVRYGGAP